MISVVIPHFASDTTRVDNLYYLIDYIQQNLKAEHEIVVVEFNTNTKIDTPLVQYVRVESNASFSRSFCLNYGVKRTKGGTLFLLDNDCLVDKTILARSEKEIMDGHEAVLPYSIVKDLSSAERDMLFNNQEADITGIPRPRINYGGALFITREGYASVGGFDPQFKGWGCEDNAFFSKVERLLRYRRIDIPMFHLWHTVLYVKCANPEYPYNRAEANKIIGMSDEQLREYVKSLGSVI